MRLQLQPTRICARDGTSGLLPGNWRTSHESSSTGGQPFYGDMMGISLAISANFASTFRQTHIILTESLWQDWRCLSLSSYWRWQVLLGSLGYIFHFTGLCTGVYQTPNTVCRWRFNMSAIWFISGIFMCANTSTCMHTRKEWRF